MSRNSKKSSLRSAAEYAEGILRGDRILLSQAITLAESTRLEHQSLAQDILEKCLASSSPLTPHPSSLRIGVTGSPGAGKSTFIETFGTHLTGLGRKVAVLAVDPSSPLSGGSILGDKTRMSRLSADPNAYVRPSPSGGASGGVAARTREAMLLCEAAGFDTILVETVGAGQSEVAVRGMVDFFLLLLLPGAGDELQGVKRGIVEMADLLAVNKADGERLALARESRQEYARALHLFSEKPGGWSPKVLTCSALAGEGMAEIWRQALDFQRLAVEGGWFFENRREQSKRWLREQVEQGLRELFYSDGVVRERLAALEEEVADGKISPAGAARQLLELFLSKANLPGKSGAAPLDIFGFTQSHKGTKS